jgi:hypothetical protein
MDDAGFFGHTVRIMSRFVRSSATTVLGDMLLCMAAHEA